MKRNPLRFVGLALLFLMLFFASCDKSTSSAETPFVQEPLGAQNLAFRWAKLTLKATANDTERFRPRPTVTSRMLALVFTSIFDAWTRYDDKAEPVYLSRVDRRPTDERVIANKEKAISYAAYHVLNSVFFSDSLMFKDFMKELKFDPSDSSQDPKTAVGIGNLAAAAVLNARTADGANQDGKMEGSSGALYSDYTGYQPVNSPDVNKDLFHWQPKYFSDGKGGKFAPACLTPHWGMVKPLLLDSANQFRPGPPPALDSEQLKEEVKDVIDKSAKLGLAEKAIVEFMRDGPKSVQQAGHWLLFAQHVSERDSHNLDEDVKMYFLVTAAAMDAFIACWDTKMAYDYARPFALIHEMYRDQEIEAWGGPFKGTVKMKGQDWIPYSPETFVCPPFPSYVSGHSTVSGACAEVLRLYTGSDDFGLKVKHLPGYLTEAGITQDSLTLDFPTFTSTAEQAGISRVWGGYHIQVDNVEGLKLGRNVAKLIWEKYQSKVNPAP